MERGEQRQQLLVLLHAGHDAVPVLLGQALGARGRGEEKARRAEKDHVVNTAWRNGERENQNENERDREKKRGSERKEIGNCIHGGSCDSRSDSGETTVVIGISTLNNSQY